MDLVDIYGCLCDRTRLRILNLLLQGPLCVCHFQEILREPQVKVSKHLAYLRKHDLVAVRREANRMIYRLPDEPELLLRNNLACLQDCTREDPQFRNDLKQLAKVQAKALCDATLSRNRSPSCPESTPKPNRRATSSEPRAAKRNRNGCC